MGKCSFLAIIPNIGTAIKIHGDGGWRIQLDISASQEVDALELLMMRDKLLRVTIEIEGGNSNGQDTSVGRRTTKKRVK